MNLVLDVATTATHIVPMAPYCLPTEAQNALDTARFWVQIAAVALAVIALILVGIGMFFQHSRGDGGQMLSRLGWWIAGVVLVAAASGIVSIFLQVPTDCIQR
ncbi:TrbC/VirB2 family protein [Microbacterium sp. BDGP8]|uniref:TrbC/VirB2 family protein n=1 Tax=Microbacterium sp. BDGP8 TaxID=3035531 RepID=UPI00249F6E00|nr:TrbC/VirB2 family protein [Microbacterium sp. BDGP8]WHE37831.1 TrbC/VirB2 family protein [Microbacterium sp. BDGP8]